MKCQFDDACKLESKWKKTTEDRFYTHCSDHKEENMICGKICVDPSCKKEGTFIIPATNKYNGVFCKEHGVRIGAVQPIKGSFCVKCKESNKYVQATKSVVGETRPQYCSKHAKELNIETTNVRAKRCIECNQTINPTYGFLVDGKKTHCTHCKKEGMVDLHTKRCRCGQTVKPSFGFGSDGKMVCCKNCMEDGMENLRRKQQPLCTCVEKHVASFGNLNDAKPTCCKRCRTGTMIDLRNRKCGCKKNVQPNFGFVGDKRPTKCNNCKQNGMENLLLAKCASHHCTSTANINYRNYCFRCFIHLFPDEVPKRSFRTKEFLVQDFVESINELKHFTVKFDKQTGGCSSRRPDIHIECLTHSIIVEIDENQHDHLQYSCENKRVMELFQDLADRPMVMIRFCPDKFIDCKGQTHKSCFKKNNKFEFLQLDEKSNWKQRLKILNSTICEKLLIPPKKEIEQIFLFFDGYDM